MDLILLSRDTLRIHVRSVLLYCKVSILNRRIRSLSMTRVEQALIASLQHFFLDKIVAIPPRTVESKCYAKKSPLILLYSTLLPYFISNNHSWIVQASFSLSALYLHFAVLLLASTLILTT
jgi:hypothetical protein